MSNETVVSFKKLHPDALLPKAMSEGASGMDLFAYLPGGIVHLEPGGWKLIPCGFAMELEPGYEAQIRPRSGLAKNFAVTVLNAPGSVDEDYRGMIGVILINHSKSLFNISHHDRIAQMVIGSLPTVRIREVEVLSATKRGEGGFGSTGTKSS